MSSGGIAFAFPGALEQESVRLAGVLKGRAEQKDMLGFSGKADRAPCRGGMYNLSGWSTSACTPNALPRWAQLG